MKGKSMVLFGRTLRALHDEKYTRATSKETRAVVKKSEASLFGRNTRSAY